MHDFFPSMAFIIPGADVGRRSFVYDWVSGVEWENKHLKYRVADCIGTVKWIAQVSDQWISTHDLVPMQCVWQEVEDDFF
jgi:hypothetical protein